jgi:hypothetical protein
MHLDKNKNQKKNKLDTHSNLSNNLLNYVAKMCLEGEKKLWQINS